MKKALLTLFLGAICMTGLFAKTAVVYFSCTGNTKLLAQTTAKATNGDLFEIVPEISYTKADLNWNDKNSRTTKECNDSKSRPAIKNSIDISSYDTVIIAYPIWWAYAPKIVYTFVESVDFSGKKVIPICTSGSSSIGNSGSDLAKKCGKGEWKNGKRFSSSVGESELKKFFDEVLK